MFCVAHHTNFSAHAQKKMFFCEGYWWIRVDAVFKERISASVIPGVTDAPSAYKKSVSMKISLIAGFGLLIGIVINAPENQRDMFFVTWL